MNLNCDTCRYWVRMSDKDGVFTDAGFDVLDEQTGQCRRYPPTAGYNQMAVDGHTYSSDGANRAVWPITWDGHWCGEHHPRLTVVEGGASA
ncbi:hypothetical protein [Sphingobium sp. WCS2017Hpa-17]|uniref:hypothetical protein n=1 Tax=Sphingobium sp. WCS2017Hpa-17 TaxID=3073638 RepID=UPI00288BB151|nr:hypothetical protein [Sphingobium sp. WCS2017Hpa-17]